jgi:hypothetical protein
MPTTARFYVAQLSMIDAELRRYCRAVGRLVNSQERFDSNASIFALHLGVRGCIHEEIILMEQACSSIIGQQGVYGGWKRSIETPFEIFKGAEQFIYGQFSGLTHADTEPFAPIAVFAHSD